MLIQALQAHQGDTGGKDPGGFSVDARELQAEGLIVPCVKLVHRGARRRDILELLVRNNRFPSFAGDLAAMISAVELGVARLGELLDKWGADVVRAAVNWNIRETERRFRDEVARWPDGRYEADVFIDADTMGNRDVRVHVACIVAGDQLTLDFTGTDDRPELVCVWNTFANTRGYAMAQLASMVDPTIPKNEGLFDAVEMIVPEGCILQPPPGKPAALGAFHPAVEVGEAICIALSQIIPERASPQVYKLGMPNAVVGFDARGQMWMDQGVDVRASDASATQGIDGWGSMCSGLGNLILASAEEAESRFPVLNWGRELTHRHGRRRSLPRPVRHAQREAGARAGDGDGVDGVAPPPAARPARRRRRGAVLQSLPRRHARGSRDRGHGRRAAAGGRDHVVPVRRRRRLREPAAARSRSRPRRRARRIRERRGRARRATASCCADRSKTATSPSTQAATRALREQLAAAR